MRLEFTTCSDLNWLFTRAADHMKQFNRNQLKQFIRLETTWYGDLSFDSQTGVREAVSLMTTEGAVCHLDMTTCDWIIVTPQENETGAFKIIIETMLGPDYMCAVVRRIAQHPNLFYQPRFEFQGAF